jgi:hypothetical protein
MAPNLPVREFELVNYLAFNDLTFMSLILNTLVSFKTIANFFNSQKPGVIFHTKLRLIVLSEVFLAAIVKINRTLVVLSRLKVQFKIWKSYAFLKTTIGDFTREISFRNSNSPINCSII